MQHLVIEPTSSFLLPTDRPICVALVGCGGTGSHVAQSLARIAYHARAAGQEIDLLFIDGDTVEAKNVGRQLFSPAELGRNKAQSLAARFSAAFGLQVAAIPEMATAETLHAQQPPRAAIGILVGCVDGAAGRLAMHSALMALSARHDRANWSVWLDLGNHESSGQVVCGTTAPAEQLAGCLAVAGVCSKLPAPSVVYPELLQAAKRAPRADCAAQQEDNLQSLMVNQMMASIGGEYLYNLIVRRRLTTFRTVVDLASLTMRSDAITARALSEATHLTPAQLAGTAKKKGRKAA